MKHVPPPTGVPIAADEALGPSTPTPVPKSSSKQEPLSDALRLARARRRLEQLRKEAAAQIDHLIELLDQTEPDADDEPWLGAPEIPLAFNQYFPRYGLWLEQQGDQERWASGVGDDREREPEHDEDGADDEPSLSGVSAHQIRSFAAATLEDGEVNDDDHDDDTECEPSLGSASGVAQDNWGAGDATDLEGEHDGRELDDSGIADFDGYMEQCPALFEHCDQRVE